MAFWLFSSFLSMFEFVEVNVLQLRACIIKTVLVSILVSLGVLEDSRMVEWVEPVKNKRVPNCFNSKLDTLFPKNTLLPFILKSRKKDIIMRSNDFVVTKIDDGMRILYVIWGSWHEPWSSKERWEDVFGWLWKVFGQGLKKWVCLTRQLLNN